MDEIDDEVRASLRRLGPEAPAEGVLAAVAGRRTRIVRRRKAVTVAATVVAVALVGVGIAVAGSSPEDPDHLVVGADPTLPKPSTTSTSTSSTSSSSSTSTTGSTSTSTSTTAPLDTSSCTADAVIAAIGAPPSSVVAGLQCVGGFGVVQLCAPSEADECPPGDSVLVLVDGAWTIVGYADDCLEGLTAHMPEATALQFGGYLWCERSWYELLRNVPLEPGGIGPVRFGMTVAEVEAAARMRVTLWPDAAPGPGGCRWGGLGTGGDSISLIVTAPPGTAAADLRRVAVVVSVWQHIGLTERGIELSDPQADVLEAYPDAEVLPNPWSPPSGRYISWPAHDHPQAITFETDGSRVTGIHAGRHYPEGCHPA